MTAMNDKILIVDDEADLLELLQLNFEVDSYVVRTAQSGAEALSIVQNDRPDLIVLDIMMDDISGLKLTGKLKNNPETSRIPIILLTAKDSETDVVVGLSVGADDYVTKPFSTNVLHARIEALLRRGRSEAEDMREKLSAGPVRIIPETGEVFIEGRLIALTGAEYDILTALVRAGGKILSRENLKSALGRAGHGQKIRVVDVHIATLRKKLGEAKKIIKTIHRRGYRIVC